MSSPIYVNEMVLPGKINEGMDPGQRKGPAPSMDGSFSIASFPLIQDGKSKQPGFILEDPECRAVVEAMKHRLKRGVAGTIVNALL